MPKIAKLADSIVEAVAEELDVPKESIISKSRNAEIVGARHLSVMLLYRNNAYPTQIAETFGMSVRNVRSIITQFDGRAASNRCLREVYKRLKDKCFYGTC